MRQTFDFIDSATTEKDDQLQHALYELGAQQLAGQALVIVFQRWTNLPNREEARKIIEEVAGYPGVTSRRMTRSSSTMVGDRAEEILLRLCRMKQGFVRF